MVVAQCGLKILQRTVELEDQKILYGNYAKSVLNLLSEPKDKNILICRKYCWIEINFT